MNSTDSYSRLNDVDIKIHVIIARGNSIFCLLVHFAYFLLVFLCHELRVKSYLFVNHAVLSNSLVLMAALITSFIDPKTTFQSFVPIVCPIFEIYWPFSIYLRSYSIVLIAIHRYIAVFRTNLFHRINSSTLFYLSGILLVWAISLGFPFINKFMFNTTYSLFYCTDGFSSSMYNRLFYSIFTIFFAIIIPSPIIVSIYVMIIRKLRKTRSKLNEINETMNEENVERRISFIGSSGSNRQREAKFAKQFICMLIVVVLLFFVMLFLGMKNVWSMSYFISLHWLITVFRCFAGIVSTFIPIFSIYFNPSRKRFLKFSRSPAQLN